MRENIAFNDGISVIREYPGGSNAITVLCMNNLRTFFRKYALGEESHKLWQQVQWIEHNKKNIPLPIIIDAVKTDGLCWYDMEYVSHSLGLFEYSHSMPLDQTLVIIKDVFRTMNESLYSVNPVNADEKTVHKYYAEKVKRNIHIVMNSVILKELTSKNDLIINGKYYKNLPYYFDILSEDNLQKVFLNDKYSEIHGDLTMENIICTRRKNGEERFYIIDPNTGNIHNSPNLDYAKMLQSLHGQYEFLKSAKNIEIHDNSINFTIINSSIYSELYLRFIEYLSFLFDRDTLKSIYFHEIIHWLRLLPYKVKTNPEIAPAYYAVMVMVINDVANMFCNKTGAN